jgi:hypothetical protein
MAKFTRTAVIWECGLDGGTNFSSKKYDKYINEIEGEVDSAPGTIKINGLAQTPSALQTLFRCRVDNSLQSLILDVVRTDQIGNRHPWMLLVSHGERNHSSTLYAGANLARYHAPLRVTALKEIIECDDPSAVARRQRFLRFPAGDHVRNWRVDRAKLAPQSASRLWKARTSPSR